jgi:hypothetical protein
MTPVSYCNWEWLLILTKSPCFTISKPASLLRTLQFGKSQNVKFLSSTFPITYSFRQTMVWLHCTMGRKKGTSASQQCYGKFIWWVEILLVVHSSPLKNYLLNPLLSHIEIQKELEKRRGKCIQNNNSSHSLVLVEGEVKLFVKLWEYRHNLNQNLVGYVVDSKERMLRDRVRVVDFMIPNYFIRIFSTLQTKNTCCWAVLFVFALAGNDFTPSILTPEWREDLIMSN